MNYGPTPENMDVIRNKALTKPNGVYRLRGVVYRVRNNSVTHYAHSGKVLEPFGCFVIAIGSYDGTEVGATKALKAL